LRISSERVETAFEVITMNWISLSLTLLLLQAPATRQAAPQTKPEDRASIAGFVIKMGTSEPLGKAVVVLSGGSGRNASLTATTTSGGQFVFQNLDPGTYRLSAIRNGYVRSEYGARSPNRPGLPIALTPGQKMTQLVIPLMTAGTITGRVYDRDGEPLANVTVQALKYSYQDGQRVLNPAQQARTNDLGEYRLFWLNPGQYFVSATYNEGVRGLLAGAVGGRGGVGIGPRGGLTATLPTPAGGAGTESEEGYIPVYYPGTTDAQSAAPVTLQAGAVFSGVDLTVAAVRTLRIQGRVLSAANGKPVRNANVMLVPRQRSGFGGGIGNFRNRNINEQGVFEIRGVVPGSYDLVANLNDRNNRMSARVPVDVGNSDVQNVTLVMSPPLSLPGRLIIDGAQTSPNNQDAQRMRVTLRPNGGGQAASPVQADGTFTLQVMGQDEYRLAVTGMPRNAYVKAARLGGTDVLNEGLRLDRPPNGQLDILVSPNAGTVDGTVSNDKQEPSINVSVVLVPDTAHRQRSDLYRTISTDALGHFHLEGVAPGDYKAFAWEDVETGAWQDPDFIRPYEERGKPIRVSENGQANIELRLIPVS
jgi:hypothetical protein